MSIQRLRGWALVACAAALTVPTVADAKIRVPSVRTPASGVVVDHLPAFGWSPVAGADHYEFALSADAGFGSQVLGPLYDTSVTRNVYATLTKQVPNGTYYWHVRSVAANGDLSPWSAPRSVKKLWNAVPKVVAPTDGATVKIPNAVVLRWDPVPWAYKYEVVLATDADLSTLVTPNARAFETSATAYTSPEPLEPGTYFWAVTPIDAIGTRGTPTAVMSFAWGWDSVPTDAYVSDLRTDDVLDPVFSWPRVPGASTYEVEVSTSEVFASNARVCCDERTTSNTFEPTNLLPNNTYWWRVRAFDAGGNAGGWRVGHNTAGSDSPVADSFRKIFDAPIVGPTIPDLSMRDEQGVAQSAPYTTATPIAQWSSVDGATRYRVQVVPFDTPDLPNACDWTTNIQPEHWDVYTAVTAWTPLAPISVLPPPVSWASPSIDNGRAPVSGHSYCVRVRAEADRDRDQKTVHSEWTKVGAANAPSFTYQKSISGTCTTDPATPDCHLDDSHYWVMHTGTTTWSVTPPLFTWKAVAGARSYWVIVAKDENFTNVVDVALAATNAYAPRGTYGAITYPDETVGTNYYWVVVPATNYDGSGSGATPGAALPHQAFDKRSIAPSWIDDTFGQADGTTQFDQPYFHWTPTPGARNFRVLIGSDSTFSTTLADVTTAETGYTHFANLPADATLYVKVCPQDEELRLLQCAPVRTFVKRLRAVTNLAADPAIGDASPTISWDPVPGAISYDVRLDEPDGHARDFTDIRQPAGTFVISYGVGVRHWKVRANFPGGGMLNTFFSVVNGPFSAPRTFTKTASAPVGSAVDAAGDNRAVVSWEPKIGATRNYHVQFSSRQDFAVGSVVEEVDTDNTAFAPTLDPFLWRDGGVVYWRVAGRDEGANIGEYTAARALKLNARLAVDARPVVSKDGRRVSVRVTVTDPKGRVVAGATVQVRGAGLRWVSRRTNRRGQVTFRIPRSKHGAVTFRAWKAGYRVTVATVSV